MKRHKPLNPELSKDHPSVIRICVAMLRDVMGLSLDQAVLKFVYCWSHMERYRG